MPDVIKTQIVQDHSIPVTVQQLLGNMSRHIVIHFCEVLRTP
jgi:hypothetical protein